MDGTPGSPSKKRKLGRRPQGVSYNKKSESSKNTSAINSLRKFNFSVTKFSVLDEPTSKKSALSKPTISEVRSAVSNKSNNKQQNDLDDSQINTLSSTPKELSPPVPEAPVFLKTENINEFIPIQDIEFLSNNLKSALKDKTCLTYNKDLHGFSLSDLRQAVISKEKYLKLLAIQQDSDIYAANTSISNVFHKQLQCQDSLLTILPYLRFNFDSYQFENSFELSNALSDLERFDRDTQFGPKSGITRLERFERAQKNGFLLPPQVKKLLLSKQYGYDKHGKALGS